MNPRSVVPPRSGHPSGTAPAFLRGRFLLGRSRGRRHARGGWRSLAVRQPARDATSRRRSSPLTSRRNERGEKRSSVRSRRAVSGLRAYRQDVAPLLAMRRDQLDRIERKVRALEMERSAGERIIERLCAGVPLIQGSVVYEDAAGRPLRYIEVDGKGPLHARSSGLAADGRDGQGPIVRSDLSGHGLSGESRRSDPDEPSRDSTLGGGPGAGGSPPAGGPEAARGPAAGVLSRSSGSRVPERPSRPPRPRI